MINEIDYASELPESWLWVNLDEVTQIILGQSPPSSTYNDNGAGLPFYQGKREFGRVYPTPQKWCTKPNKIAEQGDVLISVRAPVGPTNVCQEKSCIGRGLAAIRGLGGIRTRFLLYCLRAYEPNIAGKGTGTTFNEITGDMLKRIPIPIPPLIEQHRIVSKIEELFTRLDAGIEALKKVKIQLKQYRQAVLKYAFEGKLTEEWREKHKSELEPASVLLERIKGERRKDVKAKHKELPPLNTTILPELPKEWIWTQLGQVVSDSLIGLVRSARTQNTQGRGAPYIKMDNVTMDGKVILEDLVYVDATKDELKRFSICAGDILFNTRNSVDLVGKTGLVRRNIEGLVYNNNLMRIRLVSGVIPEFVANQMWSSDFRKRMQLVKRATTNVAAIYAKDLMPLAIVLAPTAEQFKIIEQVDHLFSVADEMDMAIDISLQRAKRLRQSILKRAFEGKLVPQDPSDEPAEKLLERIKEEKAKIAAEMKMRKRGKIRPHPKQGRLL